ncbi:ABC transporter permease [Myxococcota bacterium]|nr:ABC transporter permease [Myxococcota bacterium]
MFELFTSWRYLYNPRKSRLYDRILIAFFLFTTLNIVLFFTGPSWYQFIGAILFGFGLLGTSVFLLLHFFSVFTTISISSVLLGTTVLTLVWSVSSGFQREFKEKILGVNGHILLMPQGATFPDPEKTLQIAREDGDVVEAAPFNLNEMLIVRDNRHSGVLVKGISPYLASRVLDLPQHLLAGNIFQLERNQFPLPAEASAIVDDSEETVEDAKTAAPKNGDDYCRQPDHKWPGIILGSGLARRMGVQMGDALTLLSPMSSFNMAMDTSQIAPTVQNLDVCVVGIFFAGFEEYDQKLAYVHLNVSFSFNPKVAESGETVFGIEMRLTDMDVADAVAARLQSRFESNGQNIRVVTWSALNPQVFQNLQFHKIVIWVLLFFLITVAAFGVLSALYMLVLDKRREISILKALGASDHAVARVFIFAGVIIGSLGMVLGQGIGMLMSFVLRAYSFPLDPEVYIINRLPVSIQFTNIAMISLTTVILCILATLFPALKAARARPVEGFLEKKSL